MDFADTSTLDLLRYRWQIDAELMGERKVEETTLVLLFRAQDDPEWGFSVWGDGQTLIWWRNGTEVGIAPTWDGTEEKRIALVKKWLRSMVIVHQVEPHNYRSRSAYSWVDEEFPIPGDADVQQFEDAPVEEGGAIDLARGNTWEEE